MLFLSKIISLPLKTPKTGSFFKEDSCSTMVEYRLAVPIYQGSSLTQVSIFFQLSVFVAVTGNKRFVENINWRHLCYS